MTNATFICISIWKALVCVFGFINLLRLYLFNLILFTHTFLIDLLLVFNRHRTSSDAAISFEFHQLIIGHPMILRENKMLLPYLVWILYILKLKMNLLRSSTSFLEIKTLISTILLKYKPLDPFWFQHLRLQVSNMIERIVILQYLLIW